MGNEPPKKNYQPRLEKQRLEIACIKVVAHLELQRDRRQAQGNQKEKALIQMMNSPQRSKVDEVHKASSIVSDMNYIEGCNIVIRYCNIIKDRSLLICESVGNPQNIQELLPFIESVIWAARHLNLNALQDFQNLMLNFFGAQGIDVTSSPKIDQELKKCFETVMPTPEDINSYILKLSTKTGMTLEQINSAGHEFHQLPPPGQEQQQVQQPPSQPSNFNQPPSNFNQPPGGFQQGGQQPGVGGYFPPQQPGGFGGQGGQGGQGQVINVNVQIPGQGQFNQQQQFPQQQQQQFPQQQPQQFNQPPQSFNQPPQGFNQPSNQFSTPQQGSQQSSQLSGPYPTVPQAQSQPQSQQPSQQYFQNNQFQPGQSTFSQPQQQNQFGQQQQQQPQQPQSFNQPPQQQQNQFSQPPQNQFSQPPQQQPEQSQQPQQQQNFNQPPQQNQQFQQAPQYQQNNNAQGGGDDNLDSLQERLNRLRGGV